MAFRIAVAIIVAIALIYMISSTWSQLAATNFQLNEFNLIYWCLAVAAYVGAMFLSCLFWHRVLLAFGQQPAFEKTLLAFFASQLGKYVPGKAMVVILRTDIIRGPNVQTRAAAASVFVETLTWIFVRFGDWQFVACALFPRKHDAPNLSDHINSGGRRADVADGFSKNCPVHYEKRNAESKFLCGS